VLFFVQRCITFVSTRKSKNLIRAKNLVFSF
jgi:hypothetical protein